LSLRKADTKGVRKFPAGARPNFRKSIEFTVQQRSFEPQKASTKAIS
jgi:hypothetical protein